MGRLTKRAAINKKIGLGVSKMTPEAIGKLESVFAIDGTIAEACFYAEIDQSTYHAWVNKNPKLLKRFESLRNKPVLKARQTIVNGLDQVQGAQWYLTKKKKLEFGDSAELALTGELKITFDESIKRKFPPQADGNNE